MSRDVIVDDSVDSWDIESSTRYVRRYEDGTSSRFELVQSAKSGGLRELTVKRNGGEGEETEED